MKEIDIQRQIVNWLRAVLPRKYRCFAIPNGARRTRSGLASNAVPGLTPGVPDLMIVGGGEAMFIEVKRPGGKLSDAQSEFGTWCALEGAAGWCVAYSVDDVRTALAHWGVTTREAK